MARLASPSTIALISLLEQVPRQAIHAWLSTLEDPTQELLGDPERVMQKLLVHAAPRAKALDFADTDLSRAVGFFDASFPQALRHIPDPPLVLFVQGDPAVLDQIAFAVIGARVCTRQGEILSAEIAARTAQAGVVVVSGLAAGIDTAAHKGCLGVNGTTVAVLGSGLSHVYPAANQRLAENLVNCGGALVSEYPDHVGPRKHQFPERNRIISGLAVAVVVVEAGDKSGSLITARLALEQGREVFAMPGPVQSLVSAGCHRLIQQGAGLITGVQDVFDALAFSEPTVSQVNAVEPVAVRASTCSAVAQRVYGQLSGYPLSIDELVASLGLTADELVAALVELEVAGIVSQGPLGYIRA